MALLFRRTKRNKYKLTSLVFNIMSIKSIIASEFPEAKLLCSGFTGSVYEYSKNTVIKSLNWNDFETELLQRWETFEEDLEPSEVLAMQWANSINNLVVEYKSHTLVEEVGYIIAMERLYPCLPTAFTRDEIEAAINVAESQLEELWASGWAHGDLRRPSMVRKNESLPIDVLYNNIMLTKGDVGCVIRLVDTGFSALEQYDEDDCIETWIAKDKEDWRLFKEWILNYPRD